MEWEAILLTLQLASITTLILFVITLPLSHWLASTSSRWKPVIEAFVSMPLVLPPTVLGFYLLLLLSPSGFIGNLLGQVNLTLVFSFPGLVIASLIYSLPFMVQPIQSGLAGIAPSIVEASYVLGKSRLTTLVRVKLPNIKPSILTALVLTFAHTIGEFGIVLMIGGNIPGVTRVASIAIYDQVEALNYSAAHFYSAILLVITFTVLLIVFLFNGGYLKRLVR